MRLLGKKIILGVTGSIAAYKSVYLLRRLVEDGADVRVVMTTEATKFVSPITFQTLSGNRVYTEMFELNQEEEIAHLHLGRNADLILVAPATANIIGKMANGICNDLLSAILISCRCPVIMTPAMDSEMYENPVVQKNISFLRQLNVSFIGPTAGPLASGISGPGRMSDSEEIISFVEDKLTIDKDLKGQVILITAGPTREQIDPVRYISNLSSGKMGYAIANASQRRGARVILISGPTSLTKPQGVECIDVITTEDMCNSVINRLAETTIVIMAAAVSDFKPIEESKSKIKKGEGITLKLVKTPDILEEIYSKKENQFIVGFAAETEELINNARKKLESKHLDMIVANDITLPDAGFEKDTNIISIIDRWDEVVEYPVMTKSEVADKILDYVVARLRKQRKD